MLSPLGEVVVLILWSVPIFYHEINQHVYNKVFYSQPALTILFKILPGAWIASLVSKVIQRSRHLQVKRMTIQKWVWKAVLWSTIAECIQTVPKIPEFVLLLAISTSNFFYSKAIHSIHIHNWLLDYSLSSFSENKNTGPVMNEREEAALKPSFSTNIFSLGAILFSTIAFLAPILPYLTNTFLLFSWLFTITSWTIVICTEKMTYFHSHEATMDEIQIRESQNFMVFWGALWKVLYLVCLVAGRYMKGWVDGGYLSQQYTIDLYFINLTRLVSIYTSDYVLAIGLAY